MTCFPPDKRSGLPWPKLYQGTLLKRYKRFLADVRLADGQVITAHCPNSGRMQTCSETGRPVYVSRSTNAKRKLPYTWKLINIPTSLVGVNTLVPNRLVKKAIIDHEIEELDGYEEIRSEVKYGQQLRHARQQGVEILVYDVRIDLKQITINAPVPVDF